MVDLSSKWYFENMATTTNELFQRALSLKEDERAALASLLLESLDTEVEEGVEAAWLEEVERRMAELDSGAAQGIPWEDVKARLLQNRNAPKKS